MCFTADVTKAMHLIKTTKGTREVEWFKMA